VDQNVSRRKSRLVHRGRDQLNLVRSGRLHSGGSHLGSGLSVAFLHRYARVRLATTLRAEF